MAIFSPDAQCETILPTRRPLHLIFLSYLAAASVRTRPRTSSSSRQEDPSPLGELSVFRKEEPILRAISSLQFRLPAFRKFYVRRSEATPAA